MFVTICTFRLGTRQLPIKHYQEYAHAERIDETEQK